MTDMPDTGPAARAMRVEMTQRARVVARARLPLKQRAWIVALLDVWMDLVMHEKEDEDYLIGFAGALLGIQRLLGVDTKDYIPQSQGLLMRLGTTNLRALAGSIIGGATWEVYGSTPHSTREFEEATAVLMGKGCEAVERLMRDAA